MIRPATGDEDAESTAAVHEFPEPDHDGADGADQGDALIAEPRFGSTRVLVYGLLPALAFLLAVAAGLLKWHDSSIEGADLARHESVQAARDCTVVLMSFQPDTIEKNLASTRKCLTAGFGDTYTRVAQEMVIPYTKEHHVSAVTHLVAAASVSASENHAVVLVFADQTLTTAGSAPTHVSSSIRVSMDKVDERWLISGFDPI